MSERPTISVVIPSVRARRCQLLVRQIRRQVEVDGAELLIVDDTTDGSVADLLRADHVRVLRGESRGPAAARNLGVRDSKGELIVLLDDDVHVREDLLSKIRARCTSSPSIAVDVAIHSGHQATDGSWRWRRVERTSPGGFLAACLAVPREVFQQVGGFDESWRFAAREDTDFGLRTLPHVRWEFEDAPLISHPDEQVTFSAFLRHALFLRVEPRFLARHGMTGNVRSVRLGPVRVRGIRMWMPPVTACLVLVLVAFRRPLSALGVCALAGSSFSTSHSHYLGFVGRRNFLRSLLPDRVAPWSIWILVGGISFVRGIPEGFREHRRQSDKAGSASGREQ
jgi:GT2 family glycosyltransferase